MDWQHISIFNAFWSLATAVAIALISIAQFRRISREQFDAAKKDWADIATRKDTRIKALEEQLEDMQEQLLRMTEKIARLQRDAELWMNRNVRLYELCQDLQSRLARSGHEVPPIPEEL